MNVVLMLKFSSTVNGEKEKVVWVPHQIFFFNYDCYVALFFPTDVLKAEVKNKEEQIQQLIKVGREKFGESFFLEDL